MNYGESTLERINKRNRIDVVIPVFNEEKLLGSLLKDLKEGEFSRIIVVDANSTDNTKQVARNYSVEYINSPEKGRSKQMNFGASVSSSQYLLFLHADITIPVNFYKKVNKALCLKSVECANFQLTFDTTNRFLKANATFSRLKHLPFQFGDQGLLIKRSLFDKLEGYNEHLLFMEGNDIIKRAQKYYQLEKLPIQLVVSSRKYQKHGVYRLQFSYYLIYLLNELGASQQWIKAKFKGVFQE